MKMMSRLIMAVVVLSVAGMARADFVKTYSMPWYTDANPHVDSDGNSWAFYQIDSNSSGATSPSTWLLMTSQDGIWRGPSQVYNHPSYDYHYLTWGGEDCGHYRNAGFMFTAGTAGKYSWTGNFSPWDDNGRSTNLVFGKVSGSQYTSLYSTSVANLSTLNFAGIAELQDVSLAAGEKLVMAVVQNSSWYWGNANMNSVGFGYNVPEPITFVLISTGLLGMIRRKK